MTIDHFERFGGLYLFLVSDYMIVPTLTMLHCCINFISGRINCGESAKVAARLQVAPRAPQPPQVLPRLNCGDRVEIELMMVRCCLFATTRNGRVQALLRKVSRFAGAPRTCSIRFALAVPER